MASEISKNRNSQSEAAATTSSVTSQLHLSKSSSAPSSALDRDAVLSRLRHHKRVQTVRRKLKAVFGNPPPPPSAAESTDTSSACEDNKWLQLSDVFFSP
ncbi:unnamed protein product [Cuscuta epithymum]|uniref:Uncharacterized protein n=1 Tax=Cuscuta epithymum TaxID=186058 RepID=A0AAV0C0I9_9ASTE|nr:unnamed protein product [Cuscuta epithymum]CAH9124589.1 unnamed protein product [Cuscuta epithymum]